mmetsp:Transcript_26828/g.78412  ORF Transcript_26828/g.78412 Transcript_26828/m.78412 type:complete len:115 (+) Transcript_26828:3-347(+)
MAAHREPQHCRKSYHCTTRQNGDTPRVSGARRVRRPHNVHAALYFTAARLKSSTNNHNPFSSYTMLHAAPRPLTVAIEAAVAPTSICVLAPESERGRSSSRDDDELAFIWYSAT